MRCDEGVLVLQGAKELQEWKVSKAMKLVFTNRRTLQLLVVGSGCVPLLSKRASVMLLHFTTTYLCKFRFSDL